MKVENPFGTLINQVNSKGKGTVKPQKQGASFSEILEGAAAEKSKGATRASAPSCQINQLDLSTHQKEAISRGEDTLTLLNHLASLLERPHGRAPMESIADALGSSSSELLKLKERLDGEDPLRSTIDQIAILSVVEKIKITRGDYT